MRKKKREKKNHLLSFSFLNPLQFNKKYEQRYLNLRGAH